MTHAPKELTDLREGVVGLESVEKLEKSNEKHIGKDRPKTGLDKAIEDLMELD